MFLSRRARATLRAFTSVGFAVLYIPLIVVLVASFNISNTFTWPPKALSTQWWGRVLRWPGWTLKIWNAIKIEALRESLLTSLKIALFATILALLLGSLAAFAVHRYSFFGRTTLSLLVVLPIALPGIVTGLALNQAFRRLGLDLGVTTVVVAHATFCIVIVYNNLIARLKRMQPSLEEASSDLGATGMQTFRYVTFPLIRSALLAGALLSFALSFDEIVVTTFTSGASTQTLPQWIFSNLSRPKQAPVVNVVGVIVIVLSIVPVYFAQRLTDQEPGAAGR